MDAVSSSITIGALAANIAKNVVKLKACWEAIQDAPQDVHFLVKRLELLSLILHDIQDDQTQNPVSSLLFDGSTASTCIETCKVAADRLGQLADNMATSIESSRQLKRKWASLRVVMKKNRIERFEAELQSCIALLQLSHETYTRSVSRFHINLRTVAPSISSRYCKIVNWPGQRMTMVIGRFYVFNPILSTPGSCKSCPLEPIRLW